MARSPTFDPDGKSWLAGNESQLTRDDSWLDDDDSWLDDSDTLIWAEDLVHAAHSSPKREQSWFAGNESLSSPSPLRRSSIPPPPLPLLASNRYSSSARHSSVPPPPPSRREMPTPVMSVEPGLDAIRPESRPPAGEIGSVSRIVRLPASPPLPRDLHASEYSESYEYPEAYEYPEPSDEELTRPYQEAPHLDTLRPYAASTSHPAPERTDWHAWLWVARAWLHGLPRRWRAFRQSELSLHTQRARLAEGARRLGSFTKSTLRSTRSVRLVPGQALSGFFSASAAVWGLAWAPIVLALLAFFTPLAPREAAAPRDAGSPLGVLDVDAQPRIEASGIHRVEEKPTGKSDTPPVEANAPPVDPGAQPDQGEAAEEAPSLHERAQAGDRKALMELENREPTSLSLDEVRVLSLAQERRLRERMATPLITLAKKPDMTAADRALLLRYAGSPLTYREALLAMAENESWQGPDLIHAALRRYGSQKHVADLARSLLLTDRIYKYASPALTVAIDAETVTDCDDVRDLVERAHQEADFRAVRPLAKFAEVTGCGDEGGEDCYPCLRRDDSLERALRVASRRRPPF